MAENYTNDSGIGHLVVNVTTARGAIPLANVGIDIFAYDTDTENDGKLISHMTTDRTGKTEPLALYAPIKDYSLHPGGSKSYSKYNISAYLEGYYPQQYISVPIFDGITAVQGIDMIPISENGRENYTFGTRFFENENPYLK